MREGVERGEKGGGVQEGRRGEGRWRWEGLAGRIRFKEGRGFRHWVLEMWKGHSHSQGQEGTKNLSIKVVS